MFDWNDEELSNIIWGEPGENDDHIVPYQEGNEVYRSKKERSQEAKVTKSTVQKRPGPKLDLHARKLESSSSYNTNEGIPRSGFEMGSWPDLSLSNAAKTGQDPMGTEVSEKLAKTEKAELDQGPEIFVSNQEGKEQGDLVDYSWANIGSFDDLDRIFSNDDPIFGHVNLGSGDELWCSSKDVINSPLKSFPINMDSPSLGLGALGNTSEHLDIKTEYEQHDDQPFSVSCGKVNDPSSHCLQNAHAARDHVEYSKSTVKEQTDLDSGGKTAEPQSRLAADKVGASNDFVDKAHKQKKLMKLRKQSEEKSEVGPFQGLYCTWAPSGKTLGQFENQMTPSAVHSSSSIVSQQRQLQGSEASQYQHVSNPFMAASIYGSLTSTYPTIPVLATVQSAELKNQLLHSSYEVSPGTGVPINKSTDALARPLTMTPQEKIEKLRRRQQMQAMLAIQRQQQQFSHQLPGADPSMTQKGPQESQIQLVDGADLEELATFPSFDPSSPTGLDDSNTISVTVDDYSAEESVLYRLQDVVAKLDMSLRLCMRDSLFRLAQSATQRHYSSDPSSTNKSSRDEHEVAKEDATDNDRYSRMPDTETETNPIDRTVAHLLFHRPLELSGKHPETPESPASAKLAGERKTVAILNLTMGCKPDSFKIKQILPQQGAKSPCPLTEQPETQQLDQFRNSPSIDTAENASNYGHADVGAADVKSS